MYWGDGHMGMGGWFLMAFLWAATIAGALLLFRSVGTAGKDEQSTPLDILKARYARGEITREEFDRMRKDIEA